MERCGIFSKSGARNRFCKERSISSSREREINPFVVDQIVEVPTDKWQLGGTYFLSRLRGELNRNKVTIASPGC